MAIASFSQGGRQVAIEVELVIQQYLETRWISWWPITPSRIRSPTNRRTLFCCCLYGATGPGDGSGIETLDRQRLAAG